ncbi:hypothetical protein AAG570_000260 [Ranatra chinensis]|uniref:Uncharacterized protein n=1 Tax=Ranatra chinensis TaxID=642074 RepID=A0ABD0YWJ0_9HEMI
MAYKCRNMFYQNKKQKKTEIGDLNFKDTTRQIFDIDLVTTRGRPGSTLWDSKLERERTDLAENAITTIQLLHAPLRDSNHFLPDVKVLCVARPGEGYSERKTRNARQFHGSEILGLRGARRRRGRYIELMMQQTTSKRRHKAALHRLGNLWLLHLAKHRRSGEGGRQ